MTGDETLIPCFCLSLLPLQYCVASTAQNLSSCVCFTWSLNLVYTLSSGRRAGGQSRAVPFCLGLCCWDTSCNICLVDNVIWHFWWRERLQLTKAMSRCPFSRLFHLFLFFFFCLFVFWRHPPLPSTVCPHENVCRSSNLTAQETRSIAGFLSCPNPGKMIGKLSKLSHLLGDSWQQARPVGDDSPKERIPSLKLTLQQTGSLTKPMFSGPEKKMRRLLI